MKLSVAPALLALALGALPLAASSQQLAYTAKHVNLRAGPDRYYPVIAILPPSAAVSVYGCLADYRWCDVSYGYDRGWVYAGNLRYPYQGGYVVFPGIAPVLGIAVFAFVLDDYWSRHYHDRPFYGDRHRYEARPPHYPAPRAAPYPAPHPTPYPAPRPTPYPAPRPTPYPAPRPGVGPPPQAQPGGHPPPRNAQPNRATPQQHAPQPAPQQHAPQPAPQQHPRQQQQPQQHRPPPQGGQPQQGRDRGEPPGHGERSAPPGQRDRP